MRSNSEYTYLSAHLDYNKFLKLRPMKPFSIEIIDYLNALSKELKKDPLLRTYPDVAAFAFFCRKSNISKLKKNFCESTLVKLGRGTIFHIAPSNVPVNFAFTLIMGLLAGNANIVRVPSKRFNQIEIISDAINKLGELSQYQSISERIILIRYERESELTKKFSEECDVRVIWGGDDTINQIRKNPLQPQAFDITFSDRYSLCALNADQFINESNPDKIANDFYNDTYLFDQNACTSPHLLIWTGTETNVKKAKSIFWDKLYILVKKRYKVEPVAAINKLTNFYSQSINSKDISFNQNEDNIIWRISLNDLDENIEQFRCDSGYFSEYHASSLVELSKIVKRKYQTLSYYGYKRNELAEIIKQLRPSGIDRVVPIGRTMDFSLIWDGYSIINSLSRSIEIL